jgi:hypothetical protein
MTALDDIRRRWELARHGRDDVPALLDELDRLASADVRRRASADALAAAAEAFASAMRRQNKPSMLLLIEALHQTDAALAAYRGQPR